MTMTILKITLAVMAAALAIALVLTLRGPKDVADERLDQKYRDDDGDHLYYDESLIEKKEIKRRFPNMKLRTLKRLLRNR